MKNHPFELIPLTVEARGEITNNNLPEFRDMVREALANINRDLKTDEDFEQAEKDCKALKYAEEAVKAAAVKAFDDELKALIEALNETAAEIRAPRLELEKLVAKRKEEAKAELIRQALDSLICAPRLRKPIYGKAMDEAVKGKRTFDSMSRALSEEVEKANATVSANRAKIEQFAATHGAELVPDAEDLEVKSPDSIDPELRRRFESKKAAEEKRRLEAEAAAARAEADAAKVPAKVDPRNPHNLPPPPKIGSIPTGSNAAPPSNVVEMRKTPEFSLSAEATPDEEWREVAATAKFAFGLIKEHKEKLKHDRNVARLERFGAMVNQAWANCKVEEVAP